MFSAAELSSDASGDVSAVENVDLVVAKWQAALLSTLAAWVIVAVAVPVALMWSDAAEPILEIARNVDDALGRPRAIILGLLILAGLVGSTWKQLVQGLYIAMSGRDWAVKGIVFATLVLVTVGHSLLSGFSTVATGSPWR